ncbi:hypothetical protein C923_01585 [Plasmodium falciparum UGT5.1]|uniref:Uncharacterized protein n=1 Tax=Plasmodium falciparum UGT5.1 TaxID=1237627 RepID=W7JRQ0_PLAFA|nr:hypothetical protein C923_01585 [Plasmodium falciparum UGT5.1]
MEYNNIYTINKNNMINELKKKNIKKLMKKKNYEHNYDNNNNNNNNDSQTSHSNDISNNLTSHNISISEIYKNSCLRNLNKIREVTDEINMPKYEKNDEHQILHDEILSSSQLDKCVQKGRKKKLGNINDEKTSNIYHIKKNKDNDNISIDKIKENNYFNNFPLDGYHDNNIKSSYNFDGDEDAIKEVQKYIDYIIENEDVDISKINITLNKTYVKINFFLKKYILQYEEFKNSNILFCFGESSEEEVLSERCTSKENVSNKIGNINDACDKTKNDDLINKKKPKQPKNRKINYDAIDTMWQPHFHPHNQEFRVRYRYKGSMRLKTISCKHFGYSNSKKISILFLLRWILCGKQIAEKTKRSRLSICDIDEGRLQELLASKKQKKLSLDIPDDKKEIEKLMLDKKKSLKVKRRKKAMSLDEEKVKKWFSKNMKNDEFYERLYKFNNFVLNNCKDDKVLNKINNIIYNYESEMKKCEKDVGINRVHCDDNKYNDDIKYSDDNKYKDDIKYSDDIKYRRKKKRKSNEEEEEEEKKKKNNMDLPCCDKDNYIINKKLKKNHKKNNDTNDTNDSNNNNNNNNNISTEQRIPFCIGKQKEMFLKFFKTNMINGNIIQNKYKSSNDKSNNIKVIEDMNNIILDENMYNIAKNICLNNKMDVKNKEYVILSDENNIKRNNIINNNDNDDNNNNYDDDDDDNIVYGSNKHINNKQRVKKKNNKMVTSCDLLNILSTKNDINDLFIINSENIRNKENLKAANNCLTELKKSIYIKNKNKNMNKIRYSNINDNFIELLNNENIMNNMKISKDKEEKKMEDDNMVNDQTNTLIKTKKKDDIEDSMLYAVYNRLFDLNNKELENDKNINIPNLSTNYDKGSCLLTQSSEELNKNLIDKNSCKKISNVSTCPSLGRNHLLCRDENLRSDNNMCSRSFSHVYKQKNYDIRNNDDMINNNIISVLCNNEKKGMDKDNNISYILKNIKNPNMFNMLFKKKSNNNLLDIKSNYYDYMKEIEIANNKHLEKAYVELLFREYMKINNKDLSKIDSSRGSIKKSSSNSMDSSYNPNMKHRKSKMVDNDNINDICNNNNNNNNKNNKKNNNYNNNNTPVDMCENNYIDTHNSCNNNYSNKINSLVNDVNAYKRILEKYESTHDMNNNKEKMIYQAVKELINSKDVLHKEEKKRKQKTDNKENDLINILNIRKCNDIHGHDNVNNDDYNVITSTSRNVQMNNLYQEKKNLKESEKIHKKYLSHVMYDKKNFDLIKNFIAAIKNNTLQQKEEEQYKNHEEKEKYIHNDTLYEDKIISSLLKNPHILNHKNNMNFKNYNHSDYNNSSDITKEKKKNISVFDENDDEIFTYYMSLKNNLPNIKNINNIKNMF